MVAFVVTSGCAANFKQVATVRGAAQQRSTKCLPVHVQSLAGVQEALQHCSHLLAIGNGPAVKHVLKRLYLVMLR